MDETSRIFALLEPFFTGVIGQKLTKHQKLIVSKVNQETFPRIFTPFVDSLHVIIIIAE